MDLCHALRIQRKEIVALVGAGGKTTAMFRLARELTARGQRVVTTTTTRIFVSQMGAAPHSIVAPDEAALLAQLPEALRRHGHVLVVGGTDPSSDKAFGIEPGWVERISGLDEVDVVLIEADGARMRSFKAPAGHEPVIPDCVTLVVPMAGIDAIGRPLDEATVHRPECVAALTGDAQGETISAQMMARVLADERGGRQFVPVTARVVALLNKVDKVGQQEVARQVARLLLEQPALDGVVLAATLAEDPAIEMWGHTAAVVLAGGGSTRFGRAKLLEPWGETDPLWACQAAGALGRDHDPGTRAGSGDLGGWGRRSDCCRWQRRPTNSHCGAGSPCAGGLQRGMGHWAGKQCEGWSGGSAEVRRCGPVPAG